MTTNYLAPIILKAMIAWYPISNHTYHERPDITLARYESIAEDIAVGSEKEPAFDGEEGAIKTALMLASIARFESHYDADVDQCKRAGDHGLSWTIFQLQSYYSPKNIVCSDRKKAVEYAIKWIKVSFNSCRSLPLEYRLSVYTSGRCNGSESKSRERVRPAIDFLRTHKQEIDDVLKWGF